MSLLGIGVDCEETERFKRASTGFIKKIFTEKEIKYCKSMPNPHHHYAARFAAKEAAIKAFSPAGLRLSFKNFEVVKNKVYPQIRLKSINLNKDYNVHLSISHADNMAIAFVIVTAG